MSCIVTVCQDHILTCSAAAAAEEGAGEEEEEEQRGREAVSEKYSGVKVKVRCGWGRGQRGRLHQGMVAA